MICLECMWKGPIWEPCPLHRTKFFNSDDFSQTDYLAEKALLYCPKPFKKDFIEQDLIDFAVQVNASFVLEARALSNTYYINFSDDSYIYVERDGKCALNKEGGCDKKSLLTDGCKHIWG